MSDFDRGTLRALKDANDRMEQAERQRDEAVALLKEWAQSYQATCVLTPDQRARLDALLERKQ